MARRMVLGRRGTAYGLWISKAGADAASAGEADLLFSMSQRAGMVLASGTTTVPAAGGSRRIDFGTTYSSKPLVFCGSMTNYPNNRTCNVDVDASGFTLRPHQIVDGSWPAAGEAVTWFAVMKTET